MRRRRNKNPERNSWMGQRTAQGSNKDIGSSNNSANTPRSRVSGPRRGGGGGSGRSGLRSRSDHCNANTGTSGREQSQSYGQQNFKYSQQNRLRLFEEFCGRLEKLYDKYLLVRKRFFESYYRCNPGQRAKAEHELYAVLVNIRKLEALLSKNYRGMVEKRFPSYRSDSLYSLALESMSANVDPNPITANTDVVANIMGSEQLQRVSYRSDLEESSGTMEEYQQYRISKKKNQ